MESYGSPPIGAMLALLAVLSYPYIVTQHYWSYSNIAIPPCVTAVYL